MRMCVRVCIDIQNTSRGDSMCGLVRGVWQTSVFRLILRAFFRALQETQTGDMWKLL